MSFAYLPLFTGDYHRDTRHLTPEEHGIYLMLLIYCWDQKGPIPKDERRQCGIVNARSGGEIESLRRVLAEYFILMEDGWYNKRMSEEIARSEQIASGRRKGGLEKARRQRDKVRAAMHDASAVLERSKSRASAVLEQVSPSPSPSPSPTTIPTDFQDLSLLETSQTSVKRAEAKKDVRATRFTTTKLPEDWRGYCKAKRSDLDPDLTYEKFSNHWMAKPGAAGRKLDWAATWRNWVLNEAAPRRQASAKDGQAERVTAMLFGNKGGAIGHE